MGVSREVERSSLYLTGHCVRRRTQFRPRKLLVSNFRACIDIPYPIL